MLKVLFTQMSELKPYVLLLLISTVKQAVSDNCRTIEFLPEIEDRFLENYMIRSMKVERLTACEAECFQEPNCVSFNYGPTKSDTPLCDLNNRTHMQASDGDFITKKNYIYRYIVNPCQDNPCPSGLNCQVGFTYKGFRCICPQRGFGLQLKSASPSASVATTSTPDLSLPTMTSAPVPLSISPTPSSPPSSSSTTVPDPVLVCQSPWIEFQGSCYYLFTGEKAWEPAKLKCLGYSAQLVKIESSDENNFIKSQFLPTGSEDYWIGLTDEGDEGTWKWSDGSSLTGYTNWDPGQPSDSIGQQNCGGIRKSGAVWHDKSCSNLKGFICEK